MKRFSILCCLVLLLGVLCPVGHTLAEAVCQDGNHTLEVKSDGAAGHHEVCSACGYATEVAEHWQSCANPGVCKECGYEGEIAKLKHRKEKTWESDGASGCHSICSGCGETRDETIDHEATCADPTHCAYCGYEGEIKYINHNGKYVAIDEKTCGFTCSDCGEQVVQEHIASCETPGLCEDCGYEGEIERLFHPKGDWVIEEKIHYFECPTCGRYDEGDHFGTCTDATHCGYCGVEGQFSNVEHISSSAEHDAQWHWFCCEECKQDITEAHAWGEPVIVEPTETTDGSKTYACICGETKVEVLPATGAQCQHESSTWVSDGAFGCYAVCDQCGERTSSIYEHTAACSNPTLCGRCGYEGTIQQIAHNGEYAPIDDVSCGFQCSDCGEQVSQQHYAACDAPTICGYCGYEGQIADLFHFFGESVTVDEDTCRRVCTICGQETLEHHWSLCGAPNLCMFCGYEGETLDIYHPEAYWVFDEKEHYSHCPACGEDNQRREHFGSCVDATRCYFCGIEGEFSDGEHVWSYIQRDEESHWYDCVECKQHIRQAHEWNEPIVVEPTDTTDGSRTYTCECGQEKVEIIPAK